MSTEIALAVLGILLSVGLLKANELLEFLNSADLYELREDAKTIKIFVTELLAMSLFLASYLAFLGVAFLGTLMIVRPDVTGGAGSSETDTRARGLGRWLAYAVLALALVHFFSLALASTHMMHRYEGIMEAGQRPGFTVEWRAWHSGTGIDHTRH